MSGGILGSYFFGDQPETGTGLLGNMFSGNAAPAQSTGIGFADGLHRMTQDNQAALLHMGAALLDGQGWGGGIRGFAEGMQQDQRTRFIKQAQAEKEQKRVKAAELAAKYNLPTAIAADPDQVFSMVGQIETRNRTREPSEWEKLTQGLDPAEVERARRVKLGLDTKPAVTDDIREYEYARGQGFQGTFPQFLQAKKGTSNAPSGYTYGPDGKLAPIPGGPQDPDRDINDPLPGEIGARFGLANEYFKRFGRIESDLTSKDPRAVGPIDSLGFGQSGAIQRDMKLGSEAMIRMLTGAGMSKEEAENEVRQYLPAPNDNAATVLDKQYRLRSALRSMQREALQGRRSRRQIDTEYPEFESPDFGEVEKRAGSGRRVPLGTNRATYGAGGGARMRFDAQGNPL